MYGLAPHATGEQAAWESGTVIGCWWSSRYDSELKSLKPGGLGGGEGLKEVEKADDEADREGVLLLVGLQLHLELYQITIAVRRRMHEIVQTLTIVWGINRISPRL